MMQHKIILSIIAGVLVGVVLGGAYFYVSNNREERPETSVSTDRANYSFYERLSVYIGENQALRDAEIAYARGQYQAAYDLHQEALESASDPFIRGYIEFKLGINPPVLSDEDIVDSIQLLRRVADNETYDTSVRAFAVEALGIRYLHNLEKDAIGPIVFEGLPYKSFVDADPLISAEKLFSYALSFNNELVYAQQYLAYRRAHDIQSIVNGSVTIEEEDRENTIAAYRALLDRAQNAANENIETIIKDRIYYGRSVLLLYAATQALLELAGEPNTGYRQAFDRVMSYSSAPNAPGFDGFPRLRYAEFLQSIEGEEALSELADILKPITDTPEEYSELNDFLTTAGKADIVQERFYIARLAATVPAFEAHLRSLGWTDADLATQ